MERPDEKKRRISFNPEAVAFSPTTISANATAASDAASEPNDPQSLGISAPQHSYGIASDVAVEDTPLRSNRSMQAVALEGYPSPVAATIEGLLAQGIPMDALMRSFGEHMAASMQGLTEPPTNTHGPSQLSRDYTTAHLTGCTFPLQPTGSNLNLVDIDELSAGLGLPSAKQEARSSDSPTSASRARRSSQVVPHALYGTLIDRALNKPLTADALAQYMNSQSDTSDETVKPIQDRHDPFVDQGTPISEQGQALKAVPAPPGFGMQMPRMVTVEDKHIPTGPGILQPRVAPTAPSGYFFPQTTPSYTGTPSHHHARHSNNRKRPRGHTRTKRTDQGPEPSAADIYPDDAQFTPTQPMHPRQSYFSPPAHMSPAPVVQPEDPISWPTPAEVYTNEPRAPLSAALAAHIQQRNTPREVPVPPTPRDIAASNNDIHSLLPELPEPSINTLITFNTFNLNGDERSHSPDQLSGKRYGLNFYGIGLGDAWQPPKKESWGERYRSEPFRVRPRDHMGWGGWEWAIANGWAEE